MARVLVIEDEANILMAVRLCLERVGHEVITSTSGTKGIEQALQAKPDLVLLDLLLPDMHGTLVCRALKQVASLAHIPVVILSAYSEKQVIDSAFQAGAIDYLVKPFDPHTLKEMVSKNVSQPGPKQPDPSTGRR